MVCGIMFTLVHLIIAETHLDSETWWQSIVKEQPRGVVPPKAPRPAAPPDLRSFNRATSACTSGVAFTSWCEKNCGLFLPSQSMEMLEAQIPSCERIGVSMPYKLEGWKISLEAMKPAAACLTNSISTLFILRLLEGSTGDAPTKKKSEHGLHEPISEHCSRINRNSSWKLFPLICAWKQFPNHGEGGSSKNSKKYGSTNNVQ